MTLLWTVTLLWTIAGSSFSRPARETLAVSVSAYRSTAKQVFVIYDGERLVTRNTQGDSVSGVTPAAFSVLRRDGAFKVQSQSDTSWIEVQVVGEKGQRMTAAGAAILVRMHGRRVSLQGTSRGRPMS
jgi:hypothetical protein